MLMRSDPFRDLDRLTQQVFGNTPGTRIRPTAMRWTPGVPGTPSWWRSLCPRWTPRRVLTLLIPIAENTKPRKIAITAVDGSPRSIDS